MFKNDKVNAFKSRSRTICYGLNVKTGCIALQKFIFIFLDLNLAFWVELVYPDPTQRSIVT